MDGVKQQDGGYSWWKGGAGRQPDRLLMTPQVLVAKVCSDRDPHPAAHLCDVCTFVQVNYFHEKETQRTLCVAMANNTLTQGKRFQSTTLRFMIFGLGTAVLKP